VRASIERYLQCTVCDTIYDLTLLLKGCPECRARGVPAPLEVRYDYDAAANRFDLQRRGWREFLELMPLADAANGVSLGEGDTPLVRVPPIGDRYGVDLWVKNESANPTWSFKDRYCAVSHSMAREFGFERVVASSTGNLGSAVAAYAVAAGLRSVILVPPEASGLLRQQIGAYGGVVAEMPWLGREALVDELIERGWYPSGWSCPFGPEGYKVLGWEIVRDLGRVPDHVLVPVASGDGFYGTWKGFEELLLMGLVDRVPQMHGCQPAGANTLQLLVESEQPDRAPELPEAMSIATSIREPTVGLHTFRAVIRSGGLAVTATDDEIVYAQRLLAGCGLLGELASAAPVACLERLRESGRLYPGQTVVCVMTAAGIKWPAQIPALGPDVGYVEPDLEALLRAVGVSGPRR
jgi:threonine synthase